MPKESSNGHAVSGYELLTNHGHLMTSGVPGYAHLFFEFSDITNDLPTVSPEFTSSVPGRCSKHTYWTIPLL